MTSIDDILKDQKLMKDQIRELRKWKALVGSGNRIRATQIVGVVPPASGGTGSSSGGGDGAISTWINTTGDPLFAGSVVVWDEPQRGVSGASINSINRNIGVTLADANPDQSVRVRHLGFSERIRIVDNVLNGEFLVPSDDGSDAAAVGVGFVPVVGAFAFAVDHGDVVGDYDVEVLADSPAIFLRLDDPSGTTAVDSSGNNLDGTYNNAPALSGDVDVGVFFNAVDSQDVEIPDDPLLDFGDTFTYEIWFKYGDVAGVEQSLIAKGDDAGQMIVSVSDIIEGRKGNDAVFEDAGGGGYFIGITGIDDYHQLVIAKDGDNWLAVIDGVGVTQNEAAGIVCASNGNPLRLASNLDGSDGPQYATCFLRDFSAYPTILDLQRIRAHYAARTGIRAGYVPGYVFPTLMNTLASLRTSVPIGVGCADVTTKELPDVGDALVGLIEVPQRHQDLQVINFEVTTPGSGGGGTCEYRLAIWRVAQAGAEMSANIKIFDDFQTLNTGSGLMTIGGLNLLPPGLYAVGIGLNASTLATRPQVKVWQTASTPISEYIGNAGVLGGTIPWPGGAAPDFYDFSEVTPDDDCQLFIRVVT